MRTILQRSSYEKLIGQTVYIEENLSNIQESLVKNKILTSKESAEFFFSNYIKKVESLFEETTVVDEEDRLNRIPFVVLESSFTLSDIKNKVYYCHLTHDITWDRNRNLHQLYFLSEAGLTLLSKQEGELRHFKYGKWLS